jgi:hypothetical protein
MRDLFNRGRFWERAQIGKLSYTINDEFTPRFVNERIPSGSVSCEVSYWDANGNEVARVHQYVKPDGTLGASGLPDPRRVLINGVLYRMVKKGQEPAPVDTDAILRDAGLLGE